KLSLRGARSATKQSLSRGRRKWRDCFASLAMTAFCACANLNRLRFVQPELGPARHGGVDVLLLRPDLRWEARAAELGVGVVIEIHRGVDQHAVPLAGAEQRRVAVALAGGGIEAGAERRRHDDDVVLA